MVESVGRGRLLPCRWPGMVEQAGGQQGVIFTYVSAGGSPAGDLKALGADLNWVVWKSVAEGTTR